MKNALPFVFPVAALLIVVFLAFRWYSDLPGQDIAEFGEGVEIEELSETERNRVLTGVGDYETVSLESAEEDSSTNTGQVRYDINDGKVTFSVYSNLPELTEGQYQVWLQGDDGKAPRKAFVLLLDKGGFTGSAAISDELLPFDILVTREMTDDVTPEETILRGKIMAPEVEESAEAEDAMELDEGASQGMMESDEVMLETSVEVSE